MSAVDREEKEENCSMLERMFVIVIVEIQLNLLFNSH